MVLARTTLITGLLASLFLVAGCAGKSGSEKNSVPTITNQAWVLTGGELADTTSPATEKRPITLRIEGDVASGSTGCNRYNSSCTIDGNAITLGPMSLTKRACPEFMNAEQAFITTLAAVAQYRLEAETLTLTTTDGYTLVFRRDSEGEH